jgi:hypothetical protein
LSTIPHHPSRHLTNSTVSPFSSLTLRRTNKTTRLAADVITRPPVPPLISIHATCHFESSATKRSSESRSTQGFSYDSKTGDDSAAAALPRQRKHSSPHVVNRRGNAHSVPFRGTNAYLFPEKAEMRESTQLCMNWSLSSQAFAGMPRHAVITAAMLSCTSAEAAVDA